MAKKVLLEKVNIIDKQSIYNKQIVDVLINGDVIEKISESIVRKESYQVIRSQKKLYMSVGWMDLRAYSGFPGYEYRETLETLSEAAASGGFTEVVLYPTKHFSSDSETVISRIIQFSKSHLVYFHPVKQINRQDDINKLSELKINHDIGAAAFVNDYKQFLNSKMLSNTLLYAKTFGLKLLFSCFDTHLADNGLIHEGELSLRLGLKGIPCIAESIKLAELLDLCEYYNYPIHITNVSTFKSLELIKRAKKNLAITCDVNIYNLYYNEESLKDFNTNFKTLPPLRPKSIVNKLVKALVNKEIDAVCSNHMPLSLDEKLMEFGKAKFGMASIEIAVNQLFEVLKSKWSVEDIISLLTINPRKILNSTSQIIKKGGKANLTIFEIGRYKSPEIFFSKGTNYPKMDKDLSLKVKAVLNNSKVKVFEN